MRSYIVNRGEKLHAEKCKLKDKSGLGRVYSVHKRRMGVKDQGRVGEGGGGGRREFLYRREGQRKGERD